MILVIGYNIDASTDEIVNYIYIDPYSGVKDSIYGGLKIVTPDKLMEAINTGEEPAYVF